MKIAEILHKINPLKKDDYKRHTYGLILAGGGGTRLWPRSRQKTPKQFLKLFDNETLTQLAVGRFSEILPWEKIYVITVSSQYRSEVLKECPRLHEENVIVEPQRRETGPAHGLGALVIQHKDPNAVIITEAADRIVKPIGRYLDTLTAAAKKAYEAGVLITIGVEPRYPHTGMGHIKKGKKIKVKGNVDFYKLDKFVEKPPIDLAKKYTASGEYLWNTGVFVWRADAILASIKIHAPKIWENLEKIRPQIGTANQAEIIEKEYKEMPVISIDYAVAEKAHNFIVVAGDFFWTDIGDWREVWANSKKDSKSNVVISGDEPGGELLNIGSSDALIHTDGRMVAVVGLDNIIVVDTKDALLVCSKSHAQSVKEIVEKLKEENRVELL
ncbi:MAG: sugar phosphate nucleotidyltransferase [Candidatus Woesebacteria bacterium]|nr:sugar phosphate nucleotidyltransferase [Candidatus Woesebacteria bacterium]